MEFDGASEPLSGYNQGIEHEQGARVNFSVSPIAADTALRPPRSTSPPTSLIFDVA
jgi:hypothetical protein